MSGIGAAPVPPSPESIVIKSGALAVVALSASPSLTYCYLSAASPEPAQALRASAFCRCMAAAKAVLIDADLAGAQGFLRQIQREAEVS